MNAPQPIDVGTFKRQGFLGPLRLLAREQAHFLARHLPNTKRSRDPVWNKDLAVGDALVFELAAKPRLIRLMQRLLGEEIVLWGAQLVERELGQEHAWHCDIETLDPEGGFVSVWLGLHNTQQEKGFKLVPGSHAYGASLQEVGARESVERDERTDDVIRGFARSFDPSAQILRPAVSDGEAIIFDGRLWHGTENSGNRRAALLLQYARADRSVKVPDLSIGISNALFLQEAGYSGAREPSSIPVLRLGPGHCRALHRLGGYVSERFRVLGGRRPREAVGSGAEPDGVGDPWELGPVGISGRPWPGIGAVPGRASRGGQGSSQ